MKLNHVKVNYYKSFGEDLNNFQVEDDITVIVGKNESGKSNLLELLSKIDLLNGISDDDLNKLNRKYSGEKPSIELKFKLDNDEKNVIKERLEPIVSENIKNNLWEKTLEILDLFSELYIAKTGFEQMFGDLLERENDKITKNLSIAYKKFKLNENLSSTDNISTNRENLNDILANLYEIFYLLNIEENLKIKFDNDLEDRIKNIILPKENKKDKFENILDKYNDKYNKNLNKGNPLNFKDNVLNSAISLFEDLEDLRLDFEQMNKEKIDSIISKKMNSVYKNLEYTKFTLKEETVVQIDGAFKIYFEYEKKLKNSINNLFDFNQKILTNIENIQEIENYKKDIISLENLEYKIFSSYKDFCKNKQTYLITLNEKNKQQYSESLLYVEEGIDFIYNFIPIFYLYEEKFLEDKYTYNDEFLQNFNEKNLIYLLFNTLDINSNDLERIFYDQLSGESQDIKNKINKSIKENIEHDFNNFYKQEKIQMSIAFDGKDFAPFINSSDNTMNISEKSRGLRWYLSMFIDMKANNLSAKNVIYLIDEPAVYLHPNAQREVLEFFKSLTANQNQLIYATHSPYMIDSNQLHKVRAFKKIDGITKIYNKVYNSELSKVSKSETLSPILDAIGLDLRYNLGPSNQMLNIVTEGITDYMYIGAMANYLDIEGIHILPSVGVQNVHQLASILIGWGLDFKILLDYDDEGNKATKKLKELNLEINKDYYFLTGKDEFNREDKTVVIEDLVNEKDISEMKIDENAEKIIKARMFKTEVENENVDLSEETVRNFEQLFESLGVYEREKEPILT